MVLTGSADQSLKVWDIARNTYRQTTNLRHSFTTYCLDVGSNSFTVMSGHMDSGLRFWDMRAGDRTANISGLHEGGITSVQFHPTNAMQVLTNGKDSCLKLVDVRTCTALQTFAHDQFRTAFQYSSTSFSPNGMNELGSVLVFAHRDPNNRAFVCMQVHLRYPDRAHPARFLTGKLQMDNLRRR